MTREYVESRYDQFVLDLEAVVNIDSGSRCAPGLEAVLAFFRDRFSRIGWQAVHHPFGAGKAPCLEVCNRQPAAGRRFDALLLGHMDTVFPEGTVKERPFHIQDGRALGPGVCDMKGGLVTMLHAAEALEHTGAAQGLSLCLGFNSDEEVGSRASRKWFEGLAARSRLVLVFEPCRATGHRVVQRKGVGGFDVVCRGKAAHVGVEPQKGANAVVELAHQVLTVSGFAKPELGTTVNVTLISGGTAGNVIPDFASASADVRFSVIEEVRRVEESFQRLAENTHIPGVRVEVQGAVNRLPMVPSAETLRIWERIAAIGRDIGLDMELTPTGGASDGNFTAALGIPTVDAMGPIGGDAHSEAEYLDLASIVPNTQLVCEILRAAADGRLF